MRFIKRLIKKRFGPLDILGGGGGGGCKFVVSLELGRILISMLSEETLQEFFIHISV